MSDFVKELREVINRHSRETVSNTPDFVLSGFLEDCLNAFDCAVKQRDSWYGRKTADNVEAQPSTAHNIESAPCEVADSCPVHRCRECRRYYDDLYELT